MLLLLLAQLLCVLAQWLPLLFHELVDMLEGTFMSTLGIHQNPVKLFLWVVLDCVCDYDFDPVFQVVLFDQTTHYTCPILVDLYSCHLHILGVCHEHSFVPRCTAKF